MKSKTKDDYKAANARRLAALNAKRKTVGRKMTVGRLGAGAGTHLVPGRRPPLAEMTPSELAAKLGWSAENERRSDLSEAT